MELISSRTCLEIEISGMESLVCKLFGIFPLVWITSMDTSWNPCLCTGFFLPWEYFPFGSHL